MPRCSACRVMRMGCSPDCILAPYFPNTAAEKFCALHTIYGASRVKKMLEKVSPYLRQQLVDSLYLEAQYRFQDPVHGSIGVITNLRQELQGKETVIANLQAEIAQYQLKLSQYEAALNSEVMAAQNHVTEQYQWPNNQVLINQGQNIESLQMPAQGIEPVQWPNQAPIVQNQNIEQFHLLNHAPQMPQMPDQGMEPFQLINQAPQMLDENINMEQLYWLNQAPQFPQMPEQNMEPFQGANQALHMHDQNISMEQSQWPNNNQVLLEQDLEQYQWHNEAQVTLAQNTGMEHFQWYNQAP